MPITVPQSEFVACQYSGSSLSFIWFELQHCFFAFYRPQRSWAKVMFFTGICDSVNRGGGSASVHAGIPPSRPDPPPDQTPPTTRHSPRADNPPRADCPRSRHPLQSRHPPEQTPPPPGADTTSPQSKHPPRADTPPPGSRHHPHPPGKQTPGYGQRAAGTHPTGMHFFLVLREMFSVSRWENVSIYQSPHIGGCCLNFWDWGRSDDNFFCCNYCNSARASYETRILIGSIISSFLSLEKWQDSSVKIVLFKRFVTRCLPLIQKLLTFNMWGPSYHLITNLWFTLRSRQHTLM